MTNYSEELKAAVEKFTLTGASFAYWDGQELHRAVAGRRNSVTGDPVTYDTIMHIGSITKVINAVLLLQLVDQGIVSIEAPVTKYLPNLRLRDQEALEEITCEMLLNHSSGINGDWLPEHGPDRERIIDIVDRAADLGQLFQPGTRTSYCNIATVIAGYLTQVLRGESWYTLVENRIFEPLGMRHALADVTNAPRFRCSIGDLTDLKSGTAFQSSRAFLSPGFAPAGSTLMMSATDLVTFARSLLEPDSQPAAPRLLSQEARARMAEASGTFISPAYKAGLGWIIAPGGILTHSGVGPGVYSVLLAHPESGRVATLLTNNDRGAMLASAVMERIVESWTGTYQPQPNETLSDFDPKPYVGAFESNLQRVEVFARDSGLSMRVSLTINLYDNSPFGTSRGTPVSRLTPLGEHSFLAEPLLPGGARFQISFTDPDEHGRMQFLGTNFRLLARVW